MSRKYADPFIRHLSFFDRNHDGVIGFSESLRGNLSLGLNFPVSLMMSIGQQVIYGNSGVLRLSINVETVKSSRTMLQHVNTGPGKQGYSRAELLAEVKGRGIMDTCHIFGLWALAADAQGIVCSEDIKKYQQGDLLKELEQRRKVRHVGDANVLGFFRGGPGNVTAHSYVVKKMFSVDVYRNASPFKQN